MRLAVLADAIGKGFDAPIFHLCDVATHLLDDALVAGRQFVDLLLRQILPRQIDVLIQWHANALSSFALIRRLALRAFRERLESLRRREHGTSDHAVLPVSLLTKAMLQAHHDPGTPAVRSAPG